MTTTLHNFLRRLFQLQWSERRVGDTISPRPIEPPSSERPRISVVDDPDRPFHLVGVHGPLTTSTIGALAEHLAAIAPLASVHLDLADATIVDRDAMNALELVVDALERKRVRLRMVGLDPMHPALTTN